MGMNAIEKILASHSEQDVVRPGDVVMVEVDVTGFHDVLVGVAGEDLLDRVHAHRS